MMFIFLLIPSLSFAEKSEKKKIIKGIELPISEKDYVSSSTIFGGVGRKFATVQLGLDLLVLIH